MWIVVIIFLALVIPMVIAHEKERYQSYKKHSNGIMNHNANFREFVYKVNKSKLCNIQKLSKITK